VNQEPQKKLGVFSELAMRAYQRLGPNATVEEMEEAVRNAWENDDDYRKIARALTQAKIDEMFDAMAKRLAAMPLQ
jgi:hypothetical protein